MIILAIAIVILCIGSVSAADNDDIDANLTAIDNSQNDNIVINENDAKTDDATQGGSGTVSLADENDDENLVGSSEEDVLCDDVSGYIQIRETNSETTGTFESDAGEQIGLDVYWKSLSGMQFALLINNQQVQTFYPSGWGESWSDTLYYTPESAGTYNVMVICQGSSSRYISNTLVWEVSESIPKTETNISINPTTVAPGNDFTVSYNVYEKDTSNNVNEGTITFYDADGQIGSPIDLANPTTFSYSYNEKKVYNIYAVYSGTTNYKGSESEKSRLIVKDEGDPDPTVNLKIISVYSSYDNAYWACDDDYTFFGTYANTADKYDVVVTFEVESSSVPSSAIITYGTTTMNSVTFSGTNPTINFKSSMVGENIVKVIVDGIESNSVTVDVKSGSSYATQSISVSPTSATEGEIITLTPTVMSSSSWVTDYSSIPISGMVSIYSSSSCLAEDKIATVYTDGSSFTVPNIDATSGYEDVTFYVRFSGEYNGKYFYTPTSNSFSFKIYAAELKDTTISLSPSSYTITQGESKKITPNVLAGSESVTVGTITYYDDDNPISGYTDVSVSTKFDTSALSIGTHTITAKYNGADGYNPSEISQPVTVTVNPVVGFSISVTNPTYPANASATVTGEEGKTYILTITGTDKSFTVTIPAGQTKVTQDLGSLAAKTDYEAIVSYNGESNQTTFTISQGNPNLQVTVNGNNTLLSDTQTVTVNADGNGKVKINDGEEQDLGEITLSGLTAGMNTINVYYTGDENYTSASKEVIVNVYEKYPTEITLVLNETGIAKGASVKATPSVNNGEVTEGQVAFYYSNGDLIDTIDLSTASYLVFTPNGEEGESVSIYAKYLGTTTYAESANSEESVKIKRQLTITLTVDGKTSLYAQFASQTWDSNLNIIYAPSYIFYADCEGVAPSLKLYDNNELVSGDYVGDSDTSIDLYWTSSEGSNHIVYVEFEGNDDYLPARSNDVSVKVLTTRSPSGIELYPTYGIEGTTVTITPAIYYQAGYYGDKEYLTNGTLSIFSDYSRNNLIAEIEIGETFTYTIPAVSSSEYSSNSIYANFEGINGDYYYSSTSLSTSFYSMKENSATLTGDGETGTIEVIPDSTIVLHVEIENMYKYAQPDVKIYVDGEYKASFDTTYSGGYGSYSLNDYSLSLSGLSNGEHTVYVEYDGYHDTSRHYSNATSNTLTINIKVPAKDTTLTIANTTLTVVDLGNTITIQPTLLDSDNNPVTVGNITYYVDGDEVSNLTAGTPFTTSSTLPVGPHTITAKYCGDEGYNPSEVSNEISIEILQPMVDTLIITIENKQYPENVTATITTSKTGHYTITIGTKTYPVEIVDADNGVKTVTLDRFPVADGYEVSIVCDEDSRLNNNTSFNVTVGSVDLVISAIGNNTVYDEGSKSITVNVDAYNATGKIQFTGDVEGVKEIGEALDLSNLASGTYTLTVKYIDDANYAAEDKTITFAVLSELATSISIEIVPESIIKGGSIVITPTVLDANDESVEEGQVEIYDGEVLIATISLADKNYTYTPNKGKGTYTDAIWAKYVQNETLKLGESVSEAKTYVVELPEVTPTITLELNTTEVLVNGKILITPKVVDSEGKDVTVGTVTLSKDSYYYNTITTINVGESYEFTVDTNSHNPYQNPYSIYARYNGADGENAAYKTTNTESGSVYYHVYRNTLTLTANGEEEVTVYAGESVNLLANLYEGNGVITLHINDGDNGTISKNTPIPFTWALGDYVITADYAMTTSDYYASVSSNSVTVHVVEAPDLIVKIELDKASVSKDGTITATVNVTANGVELREGTVEFYNESDVKIGEINLAETTSFDYVATGSAGVHSIWAKYVANTVYSEANSTKSDYKIKGILTITLTRNGEGLVETGQRVYFTVTYSDSITEGLELWVNETNIDDEDGSASTYVDFEDSDVGLNNVFIRFAGNDDYEACDSNIVTVNVVEPTETTVTLELNSTELTPDGKILITPKVVDAHGVEVTEGTVTIYTDYSMYNSIGTINLGESKEYSATSHNVYENHFFYAKYNGFTGEDAIYAASQTASGTRYYHVYANTLTLTANGKSEVTVYAGKSVNILAVLYGGSDEITLHINGGNNGTIVKDTPTQYTWALGDYVITADYVKSNDYYASVSSEPITVHVVEAPDLIVKIELDKTSVSKDETLTATVNVTANGVELREGTVEFYNESDVKIGEINLAETTSFAYTATGDAGVHSIWAKYVKNTVYAEANSTKEEYKIKGILNIELTVNDESVESNVTISSSSYITIKGDTDGVNPGLVILVDGIESETVIAENRDSNSIRFTTSDKGNHKIQLYFAGNDEYEESYSNIVDLNIFERVSVNPTITVAPLNVMNGSKVIVTVSADAPGNISVYSDYECKDLIKSIAIDTGSFEYEVSVDSFTSSSKSVTLYAKYDGAKENFNDYVHGSRGSATFNVMRENSMILTNNTAEVRVGENVVITVDIADWHYAYEEGNYFSNIIINVDGVDRYEFGLKGSNELKNTYVLTFDEAKEYIIYAYYKGYNASAGYASCAPATSEALTINVKPAVKDTLITISTDNTTVFTGENIKITPTVKSEGEDVLIGNVTYKYADGTEIASEVNVNTPFEFSIATPGEYDIIATYNGADDYYANTTASSIHITVKRIVGFTLEIATVKYPNVSRAKVTSDAEGTYTITINGQDYIVELTENELSKTIDLDSFAAGNDYEAIISHDSQTKTYNFNVSQGDVELDVTVGNNTVVGETNNIVTDIDAVNVTGTISYFEGETPLAENIAIGESFDLKDLTSGLHTITVKYNGDNNYTTTSKDVTVNILAELPTEISMDINETSISSAQAVKLNVTVTSRNANVDKGTVEFYWKNNDTLIGSINLEDGDYYIFNPSLNAGNYEVYAKYVQNTELKYAESISTSKQFKVKSDLTIELTRTDSGILKPGDSASFTFILSDDSLMSEVLLYVNKTNINHYGTGSAGITFDAGDIGENDVYMIFEGNDDYNRAESNHITVKVVNPIETTVTLVLNPNEVLSGESVGIIPTVTDENGEAVTVGVVKVYTTSSYYYADPIAVINVGENGSYIDTTHYAGQSGYLYGVYTGFKTEDTIYSQSSVSEGAKYTILNSNIITLTVNDVSEVSVTEGIGVDVKATLTGGNGVITLYINGNANITLTNGEVSTLTLPVGDYELYANYTRGSDTFVSAISTPVTVKVAEKPEMSVSIELDNLSVSNGDKITATVNVTANGVELREGSVEFYNESDVKIGEINLAETTSFAYTAEGDAGVHSIWAKYLANGVYSEANSTKESYKIKGILTITLARNGEGLVKHGDRVYFTITYSDSISEGLELWVNETKLGGEDGSSSTYVDFDDSDVGLNNVFIRFTGNDDYEPCVSNNVSVEVVKPTETIIIVEVNASEAVPGQNVKVTAKVIEKESGKTVNVGTISIKDYIYGSVLKTINVGEEYLYTTDANAYPNGNPSYIYATYNGGSTSDKIYASSEQNKTTYYLVYSNTLTLTVNETAELTVYDGESVDLLANLKGGSDKIVLYINGEENITIAKNTVTAMNLPIGEYTIYAKYTRANDVYASVVSSEVKVNVLPTKATEIELISNSPVVYGNDIEITANVTSDGVKITTGQVRYYVNGVENETLNVGETLKFKADTIETYNIKATYLGTVEYKQANATAIDVVISKATNNVKIEVIPATYPENITVKVTADVSGEYALDLNGTIVKVNAGENVSVQLKPGNYTAKVIASPDEVNYENNVISEEFSVLKINTPITQDILNIDTNGLNPTVSIDLPDAEGVLYVSINNKTYNATIEDGKATVKLPALNPGKHNATVRYSGDDNHDGSEIEVNFNVEPYENPLTNDVLTVNESDKAVFTVNLPQNASGNISVVVGNKTYNATINEGHASVIVDDLAPGEYNATVIYSGDDYYARGELKKNFTVTKKDVSPDEAFSISVPDGSTNPVFSIKLPPNATGNFTVSVDGKNYTAKLVNGSASITLDNLTSGIHNVTVTYSGDGNYSAISKNTTVNVPKPVLSGNKNINVIYSAKATYKVLVTANGKPVVGEKVKITFNGKTYNVKTDSKGYASLKLNTKVKVKKYTITAEFKGVKVTNTVKVKHIIKVKNLKVKKSRKVVKIKVKLKKVNGKYLKGKKVKLRIKGKTLKAKTNKKGVATFKVKKNILKKLKVGKKYKYKVTFGKDKVVKKIKVKR